MLKSRLRQRKCRCGKWFTPRNSLQTDCCPEGALIRVQEKKAKQASKEKREAKQKLLTRRDWIKKAQAKHNEWVRLLDTDQPCISCGRHDWEIPEVFTGGKWDCGHYKSVGSHPELRFERLNTHKQCKVCNGGSGKYARKGHTVSQDYEQNLVERIGQEAVDWLNGPHEPKHYTIEQLQEIHEDRKAAIRKIKKERDLS